MTIEVIGVTQSYGKTTILQDVSLKLEDPITMLMGASGCGKSTLLRMMGGVVDPNVKIPTAGKVTINGEDVDGQHDDVVMVFQKYTNRIDLTVEENIRFPFRLKLWANKVKKAEQDERVKAILEATGLQERRKYYPAQLSGGQNQRVALARAFVLKPAILLMDEPFSALDPKIREDMQALLLDLLAQNPCQVVFVTHDVPEALLIGDRVIVLAGSPAGVAEDFKVNRRDMDPKTFLTAGEGTWAAKKIHKALGH